MKQYQQQRILLGLVIFVTMIATIGTNQLLLLANAISEKEMLKDIEETQKENEQLKKCMEANYELDFCDRTGLIK